MAEVQAQEQIMQEQNDILNLMPEVLNDSVETDDENLKIQSQQHDIPDIETLKHHGFYNRTLVFVMSGLHQGAGCAVQAETTIGSDFNNDLILTDDDIAESHLILTPIEDGLNYSIQVTCKGDNVIINGEILLVTEQTIIMHDTFIVTIGMVNINVTLHKTAKSTLVYKKYVAPKIHVLEAFGTITKKYLSPQVIISDIRNIILLVFIVIMLGLSITYYITTVKTKPNINANYMALPNVKSLKVKEISDNALLHIEAKNDLNHILGKYDLTGRLNLYIRKNILYVKGNINQYELQNWSKVLNWFDTTYGKNVNLVSLITLNNGLRRTISFKAVVADGAIPYVVSWTGDRFKPGATLPGGWIILKISDEGVVVKDAVDNRIFLVKHIRSQYGEFVPDFKE